MSLSLDPNIFRAYDIRGIVDQALTVEAVTAIGQALAGMAAEKGEKAIAVCRDGRLSGPKLVDALASGIQSGGLDVIDLGMNPTPVGYFGAATLDETNSCVVVTGSHNPPDYNGLKMVVAGETISGERIQEIRQRIEARNLPSGEGNRSSVDLTEAYLNRIVSDIEVARPMKVVVDCGNGVAGELAPKLLTMLGVEVIPMYCEIDGTFPNHHPDPSKPENLVEVIDRVKQEGADLGLAFDGDGDRVGVVTTEGKVVFPDRLLILWAQDVLSRNPGGEIIYDVKCSTHVGKSVAAAGGKPTMWKTGHSFIKAKIKETGALLAGEMSGHVFFGERWYGFDDALYAAARLMEILGKDQRPATEVFNALPDSISTPELNLKMQEGETFAFIDKLVAKASFPDGRITDIDGMRVDWDDGWGLVRSSNTTPVLVFRFEADSDEALAQVQAAFREQIHAVDAELDLPF